MSKFINGETNYNEWRDHARDNKRYLERMADQRAALFFKNHNFSLSANVCVFLYITPDPDHMEV